MKGLDEVGKGNLLLLSSLNAQTKLLTIEKLTFFSGKDIGNKGREIRKVNWGPKKMEKPFLH